jgi:hypothetical protein
VIVFYPCLRRMLRVYRVFDQLPRPHGWRGRFFTPILLSCQLGYGAIYPDFVLGFCGSCSEMFTLASLDRRKFYLRVNAS